MLPRKITKHLPKARLFHVEIGGYLDKPYYAKFRCANFIRWQLWYVCVTHRWIWAEEVARRQYPHLFEATI